MNPLLKKAKTVFDGAPVAIDSQCSVTGGICDKCHEECDYRGTCVIATMTGKIVGWFENDHLVKMNARPSKRYLKKHFGQRKEKKRGRRSKFFIKRDQESADRDQERVKRTQRRSEKIKREPAGGSGA